MMNITEQSLSELEKMTESKGIPIPTEIRPMLETFFETDFAEVRLHVCPEVKAVPGAKALAKGLDIYFAPEHYDPNSPQGLGLLSHELTHVLQQCGDKAYFSDVFGCAVVSDARLEAEADRVERRVVEQLQCTKAYRSVWTGLAKPNKLMDRRAHHGNVFQPKITVTGFNNDQPATYEQLWAQISNDDRIRDFANMETYKSWLKMWAGAPRHPTIPRKSINLEFNNFEELISALVGAIRSRDSQVYEYAMARDVLESVYIRNFLAFFVWQFRQVALTSGNEWMIDEMKKEKGRYSWYYARRLHTNRDLWDALKSMNDKSVKQIAAYSADLAYVLRNFIDLDPYSKGFAQNGPKLMTMMDARGNHWGGNESSEWVRAMREHDFVLGAGPSATTLLVMAFANMLFETGNMPADLKADIMTSLAWGLFAFWNSIDDTALGNYKGAIHTFHEVMMVAEDFGVEYRADRYPDSIPPNVMYS